MKRTFTVALTAALAIASAPALAHAAAQPNAHVLSPASDVSATFTDAKLYAALDKQLTEQNISHTVNESTKTVTIASADVAKVTQLNLGYSEISDLTGIGALAALPNLTRLQLDHNALAGSAASPLSALTNLTYLDLYENKLDNWTFLGSLTKLEHLNLGLNKRGGDTREALKKLKNLKWLDWQYANDEASGGSYNYIVECLSGLTNLEYLDLCNWRFSDFEGLVKDLTKLKVLIVNENYINDLTPLLNCPDLEELHVAGNRMYWGHDKGVRGILNDDGTLKLKKLRVLDMWGQETRADSPNWLDDPTKTEVRKDINALYRLHKQGKLCLGYDYRWVDDLATLQPHTDSRGIKYIAYDDFGTFAQEGYDDWGAMRNAQNYANEHGCEVRAVVGEGATAAKGKTYHYYRLYDREPYYAYTNVDWQGATFVIHHEEIDWHYRCSDKPIFYFRPSPEGFAEEGTRLADTTLTLEASATDPAKKLTINTSKLPMARTTTSIQGLSPELDAAITSLNAKGYARYFVQFFDAGTLRYKRGYTYKYPGEPQWDALIVDGTGAVVRQNAAKLSGTETPAGSYIPADPLPLQWQFDNITKVVIAPIASTKAYIKNATFVVNPLNSRVELPRERWGSAYFDNLEISGTNFELANITQTVGTAETGWDHNEYSGNYVGFISLKDCAELDMHDCYTWDRICSRSTYGFSTARMCVGRIKNVGDSNPGHPENRRANVWGNHGGNYAKHMLWENITLGRIDQHTGCYDMAVRDSFVYDLALTGAGPLTVERTAVVSGNFFNFRGDYGSTWDGVANVIDCTHYPVLDSKEEPDSFAACTPQHDWDFGYPQTCPEMHVKNFTIDCSKYFRNLEGTRYRITYGFPANYLNGLNTPSPIYPTNDYWPDVFEVDGVDIRNWSESLGSEPHVLFPLYATGKPIAQVRSGDWTFKNITFDGEAFTPATFEGADELVGPGPSVAGVEGEREKTLLTGNLSDAHIQLLEDELEKSDIVVAYTGDEPRVLLRMRNVGGNPGYVSAYPYYVEHRADMEVAYYSGREFTSKYLKRKVEYPDAGNFYWVGVYGERIEGSYSELIDGTTNVLHVRLAKTHVICDHEWGEPSYTWSADYSRCTARRVCGIDSAHVAEETAEATAEVTRAATCAQKGETTYTAEFTEAGFAKQVKKVDDVPLDANAHDWGAWTVTKAATVTEEGVETRVCKHDSSHVETRSIPRGEGDPETADSPLSPTSPDSPVSPNSPASPGVPRSADTPATPVAAKDPGWTWDGRAWHYELANGLLATGWLWDGGNWYYLDRFGSMTTGWMWDNGEWYYLVEDGNVAPRGSLRTGWLCDGGAWYYLVEDAGAGPRGSMRTGWICLGGEWYYLSEGGDGGFRGVMRTGWVWDGSGWYYFWPSGVMARSCTTPDNLVVGPNGRWAS